MHSETRKQSYPLWIIWFYLHHVFCFPFSFQIQRINNLHLIFELSYCSLCLRIIKLFNIISCMCLFPVPEQHSSHHASYIWFQIFQRNIWLNFWHHFMGIHVQMISAENPHEHERCFFVIYAIYLLYNICFNVSCQTCHAFL